MNAHVEYHAPTMIRNMPATLFDRQIGCYFEEYFHEALKLERKRTERSERPYKVMIIDVARVAPEGAWRRTACKVVKVLASVTRTTDIKGWYLYGSLLGVILTDSDGIEEASIGNKITAGLSAKFTAEQVGQIVISFHTFPDNKRDPSALIDLTLYPDLEKRKQAVSAAKAMKRTLDIAGASLCIVLFLPLFAAISLWIKLTSRGPVLFRQERVGQYGRKFTFLKFRSMYVDNDDTIHRKYVADLIAGKDAAQDGGTNGSRKVYKITDDPRITPAGRFLRKSSLDELPQFFNVLLGDMSLVGPRPPISYEVEKYDIWHRRRIMELKPGITGLWQVKGRSSTSFDEMVRLDLQYAREWSLWLDLRILFATPLAVVKGAGAY